MIVLREDEINQIEITAPHVVLLGAGASYASFINGDKYGRKLPLMNGFVKTLEIEELIKKTGLMFNSNNFEDIYSAIHAIDHLRPIREELEAVVFDYFYEMQLPDQPTIYDHLVLSLREKDFIATFNWDPFLVQAIARNSHKFPMPKPLFLHGNVAVGYCRHGHCMGNNGMHCSECGEAFSPTKLLYPIGEKNYHVDEFISKQWKMLEIVLSRTYMVTIFGYGAPTSDATAIDLLKNAWGSTTDRVMEEIEIIDVRDKDDLCNTWSKFIHSHHFRTENNFYDSWIANHPRRTGEAYINQFYHAKFIENNPIPKDVGFDELWSWYDRLKDVEDQKRT